jgi:large subunit ribosomal protein L9
MFGSVGTSDIAEFLGKEGFEIDRHAVMLKEPIKELGVYDVPIQLFKDVRASLNVWVVKDESS